MRCSIIVILALLCAIAYASYQEAEYMTEVDTEVDAAALLEHAQFSMDTFEEFMEDTEEDEDTYPSLKFALGANLIPTSTPGPVVKAAAGKSVDYSLKYSVKTHECFLNEGMKLAIPRGYRSNGKVDTNLALNMRYALAAGFEHVHTYIFPCPKCAKTGAEQIQELADYMKGSFLKPQMVWLDIEQVKYWSTSLTANRKFFESMVAGCVKNNLAIGVYTSKSQWNPIMGSYTGGSKYPLWYAHYDNKPDFSDAPKYANFGGWKEVNMKQYKGDTKICNVGVDLNVY